MTRPLLLDLFCGQGGAAMGYHRAGFDVVGVDSMPQPRYPFLFVQADALDVLRSMIAYPYTSGEMWRPGYFAAIHASPVCKRWAAGTPQARRASHPDQIAPVRTALLAIGLPWVIENVPRAPLRPDLKLCGCMFGLPRLKRERWFETSWPATELRQPCDHRGGVISVVGGGSCSGQAKALVADWKVSMGIDWMSRRGMSQAIPPAYTEHIGRMILAGAP
jgi:DNA (cytosine-5)-methyltransferase 1